MHRVREPSCQQWVPYSLIPQSEKITPVQDCPVNASLVCLAGAQHAWAEPAQLILTVGLVDKRPGDIYAIHRHAIGVHVDNHLRASWVDSCVHQSKQSWP
jgi:hypothetical protein